MSTELFFVQLINGLQYGLLLFLIASGLTLVFGVMGILNLAHGSMYMVGAYLVWYFVAVTAALRCPPFYRQSSHSAWAF